MLNYSEFLKNKTNKNIAFSEKKKYTDTNIVEEKTEKQPETKLKKVSPDFVYNTLETYISNLKFYQARFNNYELETKGLKDLNEVVGDFSLLEKQYISLIDNKDSDSSFLIDELIILYSWYKKIEEHFMEMRSRLDYFFSDQLKLKEYYTNHICVHFIKYKEEFDNHYKTLVENYKFPDDLMYYQKVLSKYYEKVKPED